jgi:hypothetical protein
MKNKKKYIRGTCVAAAATRTHGTIRRFHIAIAVAARKGAVARARARPEARASVRSYTIATASAILTVDREMGSCLPSTARERARLTQSFVVNFKNTQTQRYLKICTHE